MRMQKDEKRELKEKKDKFFSDMLPDYREDENGSNSSDGSDCEIVQSVQNSDFTFNPLTPNVRKAICDRLSMPFHKADLKHENIGKKLFNRNPKVKRILADGNCLFRGLTVATTGWETCHLYIRQLICEYISDVGTYTKEDPVKYLRESKMKCAKDFGTDVEIMAAAQVLGTDIYVYHTYGSSLKWLRYQCKHSSGVQSGGAIYLDNRTGDGNTGHFDYVLGLF